MSLTPQDKNWHDVYEKSTLEFQKTVNDMMQDAVYAARCSKMIVENDDRWEILIAAITRYLVESGNTLYYPKEE